MRGLEWAKCPWELKVAGAMRISCVIGAMAGAGAIGMAGAGWTKWAAFNWSRGGACTNEETVANGATWFKGTLWIAWTPVKVVMCECPVENPCATSWCPKAWAPCETPRFSLFASPAMDVATKLNTQTSYDTKTKSKSRTNTQINNTYTPIRFTQWISLFTYQKFHCSNDCWTVLRLSKKLFILFFW